MKATCVFCILHFNATSKTANRFRFLLYCTNVLRGFKKETRDAYERGCKEIMLYFLIVTQILLSAGTIVSKSKDAICVLATLFFAQAKQKNGTKHDFITFM